MVALPDEIRDPQEPTGSLREAAREALLEVFAAPEEDLALLGDLLLVINPYDLAELLPQFKPAQKVTIVEHLSDASSAIVVDEMDELSRRQVLEGLGPSRLARILERMPSDDSADLLHELPQAVVAAVMDRLSPVRRAELEHLTRYHPESAGGIMTTEVISLSAQQTAAEAIEAIRAADVNEIHHNIFVVDEHGRLTGVLANHELIRMPPDQPIAQTMKIEPIAVQADVDQEEVASLVSKYNISSIPVVDHHQKLLGVVTVDDIIDVIEQEAEEDFARMSGHGPVAEPLTAPIWRRLRSRLPFLMVTLAGVFVIAFLMGRAEETFREFFILVSFIPGIMALSGNVGLQSSTVIVRGLATGEYQNARFAQILVREATQGVAIGVICGGLAMLAVTLVFQVDGSLAWVVGISMASAITLATVLGTLIPFLCSAVGVDPALASGPFFTTFNDVAAILLYTLIGTLLLNALHSAASATG